jgi:hypothetical protein
MNRLCQVFMLVDVTLVIWNQQSRNLSALRWVSTATFSHRVMWTALWREGFTSLHVTLRYDGSMEIYYLLMGVFFWAVLFSSRASSQRGAWLGAGTTFVRNFVSWCCNWASLLLISSGLFRQPLHNSWFLPVPPGERLRSKASYMHSGGSSVGIEAILTEMFSCLYSVPPEIYRGHKIRQGLPYPSSSQFITQSSSHSILRYVTSSVGTQTLYNLCHIHSIWKVDANILKKLSRQPTRGGPSAWGLGEGPTTPRRKK